MPSRRLSRNSPAACYGLWVVGCGLWVVGCVLWVVVYGLWFVVCGLWFAVCGHWGKLTHVAAAIDPLVHAQNVTKIQWWKLVCNAQNVTKIQWWKLVCTRIRWMLQRHTVGLTNCYINTVFSAATHMPRPFFLSSFHSPSYVSPLTKVYTPGVWGLGLGFRV